MIQKHADGRGGNAPSSEKVLNGMRKRKRQDMIFAYAVLIFPVLHFIVFWLCMNVSTVFLSFRSGNMQVGEWNDFRNYTGAFKAIFGIDKNDGMIMNWRALLNAFAHSFEHAYQPSDNAHIFVRYFQKNQGLHDLSDSVVPSRDDFRNRFVLRFQDVHKRQSGGFQQTSGSDAFREDNPHE